MSRSTLQSRLRRLERQTPIAATGEAWIPWECSAGYVREVFTLLRESGHLATVAAAYGWDLGECLAITEEQDA